MRKDVREFIRRLEAAGLTVESTPGHYRPGCGSSDAQPRSLGHHIRGVPWPTLASTGSQGFRFPAIPADTSSMQRSLEQYDRPSDEVAVLEREADCLPALLA